jgi:hypothetical protein
VSGLGWWLADQASRLLDQDERQAVRGDFTELGMTSAAALREVLGLVVRRQIGMWANWGPWLALVGLVVPLGFLLNVISRHWAASSAVYAWLYVNNWTWGYLESPGARLDLLNISVAFVRECITLTCWAWTVGFALGSLSRRASWINGGLFGVVLLGGTIAGTAAPVGGNAVVLANVFYRVLFLFGLRVVLVLLPALAGMLTALRLVRPPLSRAIGWFVAVTILTWWAAPSIEFAAIWSMWSLSGADPLPGGISAWRGSLAVRLLPAAMLWPAGYLITTASWPRRRTTTVAADD